MAIICLLTGGIRPWHILLRQGGAAVLFLVRMIAFGVVPKMALGKTDTLAEESVTGPSFMLAENIPIFDFSKHIDGHRCSDDLFFNCLTRLFHQRDFKLTSLSRRVCTNGLRKVAWGLPEGDGWRYTFDSNRAPLRNSVGGRLTEILDDYTGCEWPPVRFNLLHLVGKDIGPQLMLSSGIGSLNQFFG